MQALIRGIKLSWTDKRFRQFFWKPLIWSIVAFMAIMIPLRIYLPPWIQGQFAEFGISTGPDWVWRLGINILLFLISGTVFYGLNGILSSFVWEELSLFAEQTLFGSAPNQKVSFATNLKDTFARLPASVGLSILAVLLSFTPMGIGSIWPNGRLCILDFSAPAFLRRGIHFKEQKALIAKNPRALEFLLSAGVVTLFPFLNLLCLPGLVIASTIFVRESEASVPRSVKV
ncbi:MAG: hypothetical protein K8R88_15230 [Armatimonadetes bacterium]|nr:hypothetical protein [Armatimonadota bacterium]